MCFTRKILVFAIEKCQENNLKTFTKSRRRTFSRSSLTQIKPTDDSKFVFVESIDVTNSMCLIEEGSPGKNKRKLTIQTLKKFKTNNRESFSVMTTGGEQYEEIKSKFEELIESARIKPKGKHQDHEFVPVLKHDISTADKSTHPTCGECGIYIFGFLFLGYECKTCDGKYFHDKCFLEGKPDDTLCKYKGSKGDSPRRRQ